MSNMHTDFIDGEGTITDGVPLSAERYYVPVEHLFITQGTEYVRIVMDDGATDLETRIPFSFIEQIHEAIQKIKAPPAQN